MLKSILFILFFSHFLVISAQEVKVDSTTTKTQPLVDKYDLLILNAANAVANENFTEAKALYTEALTIKPNDPFASGMLITVNNSLKALEVIRQRSADLKRKDDINKLLSQAQTEVMAKSYESARIHYNQVLSLQPIKSQEDFVKQRLRAIEFASGGAKNNSGSNTGDTNNLLAKKVTGEEHSAGVAAQEQKMQHASPAKTVADPAKGVAKIENDSFKSKTPATGKADITQKSAGENEKKQVFTSGTSQPASDAEMVIKEPSSSTLAKSSSSSSLPKQTFAPKQDDTVKKKAEVIESKKLQSNTSVNLVASKNRVEPISDIKPVSVNTNSRMADSLKQIGIQKQNAEAKKKLQENESRNLPPANTSTQSQTMQHAPLKEEQKMTAVTSGINSGQSKEVTKQNDNVEIAKKAKIDSLIESAIKAINREKWETALTLYTEALSLQPTAIQQRAINSEITVIKRNIAKSGTKSTDVNLAKTATPTAKVTPQVTTLNPSTTSTTVKTREMGTNVYNNRNRSAAPANDSNRGITIGSVPNAVENTPATDPSSTSAAIDNKKEDVEIARRLITNAALSYLSDNNNEVKIFCQSIFTNDNDMFLKFLVKNTSAVADFNIGTLQLTVIKSDGNLKRLHPKYIAESAVIAPKKESSIVIVAENQTVIEPNEAVIFEMEDQQKKTKLTINISGTLFSGENANSASAF